jgi:hypothetical protein
MISSKIKYSLKGAITGLRLAEHELDRPDEDVVTMSVCLSAKASMDAFMRQYLISRSVIPDAKLSLTELIALCAAQDARFGHISLEKVMCNHLDHKECESRYCLSTRAVKDCVKAARQLKRLVLEAMNLSEAELV